MALGAAVARMQSSRWDTPRAPRAGVAGHDLGVARVWAGGVHRERGRRARRQPAREGRGPRYVLGLVQTVTSKRFIRLHAQHMLAGVAPSLHDLSGDAQSQRLCCGGRRRAREPCRPRKP